MIPNNSFISISDNPFSRRGSYLAMFCAPNGFMDYGKSKLYLGNVRGTGPYRQILVELLKDGAPQPAVIETTESEVILQGKDGQFRFCIGERKFMRIRGTDGLGLRLSVSMSAMGGNATNLQDGCWKFDMATTAQGVLIPFRGEMTARQAFGGNLGGTVALSFEILPDAEGVVEIGLEEFLLDPLHRPLDQYPSYEECVKSCADDFEDFCKIYTELPAAWEPMRRKALWTIWSLIVDPDGETMFKHSMIKMLHGTFEHVSGWQQGMHIICLARDAKFAWGILRGLFDYQDENGRIADIITDVSHARSAMKPPIQGLALNWLLDHTDISEIDPTDLTHIYKGMVRWSEFFFRCRDIDGDGVMENCGCMETGWEDAPFFRQLGWPIASPDMNAYVALQLEAQAKLGRALGEKEEVCAAYEKASKELIARIVDKFWDGERWFAVNAETGVRSATNTLSIYCVLVLGKRLPQDIIDKSIATLFEEHEYITPFGIASESLDSPFFAHGFSQGSIIPPAQLLMTLAMEECGREDLAKDIAVRYITTLRDFGLFHTHNALTGEADRTMVAFDEKFLFWSAWSASIYLFMADRYGK